MNSRQPTQKTLMGIACTQSEFKDAIAESLRRRGKGKPRDIEPDLGPEWIGSKIVGKTMYNMANYELLIRDEDGNYRIADHYDLKRTREFEGHLVQTLRARGGFAHTHEILDDFGCRPNKADIVRTGTNAKAGSDYRRIHHVLSTSKLIKRYYKAGCWGLLYNEIQALPVPGEWIEFMELEGYFERTPGKLHTKRHGQRPVMSALARFELIGTAFLILRDDHELTPEQLLKNDRIREAFEDMGRQAPFGMRAVAAAKNEIRETAIRDATEEGRGEDVNYIEKLRDERKELINEYLLLAFENGSPLIHRASTAELFRAYEAAFKVNAADLSRGNLFCDPNEGEPLFFDGLISEIEGMDENDTDELADEPARDDTDEPVRPADTQPGDGDSAAA